MRKDDSGIEREASRHFLGYKIEAKEAAYLAGRSLDTIPRWCRKYGIGRQLHPNGRWVVDSIGLAVVLSANADALAAYQRRDVESPCLTPYLQERAA